MSWQAYVDDQLIGSGMVSQAAILGLDGQVWASSASCSLKKEEATKIVSQFSDPNGALQSGVTVGGVKYLAIRADDRSIYGKKGATGVVACKTAQAVLVALYGETVQPGQATNVVEKLADYLRENGY
eukprot:TRINITY_DN3214_c0_g1_i1.p2 TRINITY_DN3214_c0_g1~~TRINITY_DN3214_c0_g1_i1.p2  ORF type:complete len:127 (+),score=31.23 TRINITY_DN3214_c0_g1_i1:102-482(+)